MVKNQVTLQLRPTPVSTSSATQMLPIVINHKTEPVKVKVLDIESQPMLPA